MTPEQRRAYIDTTRRMQPIEELRRKAVKSCRYSPEYNDLTLREWYDRDVALSSQWRSKKQNSGWNTHFCSLCSQFGQLPFDEETGSYAGPVRHKPRCTMNPIDDGPYPGWTAAGIPGGPRHD